MYYRTHLLHARAAWLTVSLLFFAAVSPAQSREEALQSFAGQRLLLAHVAGTGTIKLKRTQLDHLKGDCDVAVLVKSASWKSNTAEVELHYIGYPLLANGKAHGCPTKDNVLAISGFAADEPGPSVSETIQKVLLTPEQYLKAKGMPFDLPAASDEETAVKLEPPISAPVPLLRVNAFYTDLARYSQLSGAVLLRFSVGTDGRAHHVRIVRPLGAGLDENALEVLPLWRFQPARDRDKPTAVRCTAEMSFNILAR